MPCSEESTEGTQRDESNIFAIYFTTTGEGKIIWFCLGIFVDRERAWLLPLVLISEDLQIPNNEHLRKTLLWLYYYF